MHYGDEDEMCMVYLADYPPQGNCKSVIEAFVMANNVREENAGFHTVGSHRTVYGGSRSHTLEELAALWKAWSVCDRPIGQAVKVGRRQGQVAALTTNDSWKIHEASLMLMECDSGAPPCSFFRTFEFDGSGSQQFVPLLMESDCYKLVRRLIEIIPANEIRRMGEIVRQANTGVRRHGTRASLDSFSKRGRK